MVTDSCNHRRTSRAQRRGTLAESEVSAGSWEAVWYCEKNVCFGPSQKWIWMTLHLWFERLWTSYGSHQSLRFPHLWNGDSATQQGSVRIQWRGLSRTSGISSLGGRSVLLSLCSMLSLPLVNLFIKYRSYLKIFIYPIFYTFTLTHIRRI